MPTTRLLEQSELAAFLEIEEAAYPVEALDTVRLGVISFFERLCGRTATPFSDALTARVEYHDGTGNESLWLDYPLAALTSITLGQNHALPDETLVVNDAATLSQLVGSRLIERLDGGYFGELDVTRAVKVTYDTQADRPEDAKLAVCRVIAQIWRQRGAEDAAQETVSGYSRQMADLAAKDAVWLEAVKHHTRPTFR